MASANSTPTQRQLYSHDLIVIRDFANMFPSVASCVLCTVLVICRKFNRTIALLHATVLLNFIATMLEIFLDVHPNARPFWGIAGFAAACLNTASVLLLNWYLYRRCARIIRALAPRLRWRRLLILFFWLIIIGDVVANGMLFFYGGRFFKIKGDNELMWDNTYNNHEISVITLWVDNAVDALSCGIIVFGVVRAFDSDGEQNKENRIVAKLMHVAHASESRIALVLFLGVLRTISLYLFNNWGDADDSGTYADIVEDYMYAIYLLLLLVDGTVMLLYEPDICKCAPLGVCGTCKGKATVVSNKVFADEAIIDMPFSVEYDLAETTPRHSRLPWPTGGNSVRGMASVAASWATSPMTSFAKSRSARRSSIILDPGFMNPPRHRLEEPPRTPLVSSPPIASPAALEAKLNELVVNATRSASPDSLDPRMNERSLAKGFNPPRDSTYSRSESMITGAGGGADTPLTRSSSALFTLVNGTTAVAMASGSPSIAGSGSMRLNSSGMWQSSNSLTVPGGASRPPSSSDADSNSRRAPSSLGGESEQLLPWPSRKKRPPLVINSSALPPEPRSRIIFDQNADIQITTPVQWGLAQ